MDSIDDIYETLFVLRGAKKSLDPDYMNDVNDLSRKMMEGLLKVTGKYLHKLKKKKPEDDVLKKMIHAVPASLSYKNEKGQLPIQSAARSSESIQYIPLLAVEGKKHNIGGDRRGGLITEDHSNHNKKNVIQMLVYNKDASNPEPHDLKYLNVVKKLTDSNLLMNQDIQSYNLLYWSSFTTCQLRFNYLAKMNPNALKKYQNLGKPLIQMVINESENTKRFQMFLSTALQHFPNEIGLLFEKNERGKTAFECALTKYGHADTFGVIDKCIPLDEAKELPILHRVVQNAPHYLNKFGQRYPSSVFVRDTNGRKLYQTELSTGTKSFRLDSMFFLRMTDKQLQEKDPPTALYPFLLSASHTTSDLSAVYYLLRRNPSLVVWQP